MAKVLILYGTDEGQTRKITERIAEVIRGKGHEIELVPGNRAPASFSPRGFDAALVGTSIHMGLHQISVRKLVRAHRKAFAQIPSAYFCVCLTVYGNDPQHTSQVERYFKDFVSYTGWQPGKMVAFAGALRYPYYNFIKRFIAKLMARRVGADTDTKGEFEYTDWNAVTRFAEEFADSLEL